MGTDITPEEAYDMALVAFGSGTGGLYIKPEVAKELKDRFLENFVTQITNDPGQWDTQKLFILECARAIGRLSAQKAVARGSFAINWEDDAKGAMEMVVSRYGGPVPGAYCQNPTAQDSD